MLICLPLIFYKTRKFEHEDIKTNPLSGFKPLSPTKLTEGICADVTCSATLTAGDMPHSGEEGREVPTMLDLPPPCPRSKGCEGLTLSFRSPLCSQLWKAGTRKGYSEWQRKALPLICSAQDDGREGPEVAWVEIQCASVTTTYAKDKRALCGTWGSIRENKTDKTKKLTFLQTTSVRTDPSEVSTRLRMLVLLSSEPDAPWASENEGHPVPEQYFFSELERHVQHYGCYDCCECTFFLPLSSARSQGQLRDNQSQRHSAHCTFTMKDVPSQWKDSSFFWC